MQKNYIHSMFRFLISLLFAISLFSFYGCGEGCDNPWNWYCGDESSSRNVIDVNAMSLVALDSIILHNDSVQQDSLSKVSHSHYYENYTPFSKILKSAVSTDSTISPIYFQVDKNYWSGNDDEYIRYKILYSDSNLIFMDIYGCHNRMCSDANKLVFHDSVYHYIEILDSSFTFSKNSKGLYYTEFGENCELNVSLFFRLKINTSRIKIDWNVQQATEICETDD